MSTDERRPCGGFSLHDRLAWISTDILHCGSVSVFFSSYFLFFPFCNHWTSTPQLERRQGVWSAFMTCQAFPQRVEWSFGDLCARSRDSSVHLNDAYLYYVQNANVCFGYTNGTKFIVYLYPLLSHCVLVSVAQRISECASCPSLGSALGARFVGNDNVLDRRIICLCVDILRLS